LLSLRLAALACLNAWGAIREIALSWWKQGSYGVDSCGLSECVLRPIDCGSAALCILIGQAPEELLKVGRWRPGETGAAGSRHLWLPKEEPIADIAAATTPSIATPVHTLKNQYAGVALSDTALVDICVHSVVPFCIAVLQSVELADVMPVTNGCGIFHGLMRWALGLKPAPNSSQLSLAQAPAQLHEHQQLAQHQQFLSKAVDEATVSRLIWSLDLGGWCRRRLRSA
jgi:hypothetical protein